MINPCVTVFIPVYNGEAFITEAIKSVLDQSFSDFELLIIDDGSTDRSTSIIESFKDNRIRFLKNQINSGISFTRNRAIKEAKGEFLAFLDADDIALPMRLEKQVKLLKSHSDIAMCGSHAVIIDDTGKETGKCLLVTVNSEEIMVNLLFQNTFVNSSVMFRMSALRETNGYYDGLCEDYEMAIQLNSHYKLINIDEVLVKYRMHTYNTSKIFAEKMSLAEKYVIKRIHKQLGIENNRELEDIHHTIMTGRRTSLYSMQDYEHLLLILRNANLNNNIYPVKYFDKSLFTIFYNRLRVEKRRGALFQFFRTPLYHRSFVSFKMIRKMVKQSIWFNNKN